jgi:hypothetical protein
MNLSQAFMKNVGTCRFDVKGEDEAEAPQVESTDAKHRGGTTRMSVEPSVMEVEQRGCAVRFQCCVTHLNW